MSRAKSSTSNFGVSARENHDAAAFYQRFTPPVVSTDDTVLPPTPVVEPFQCGDSRNMSAVQDGSVALVVTSPPYFVGKQYEEELGANGIPATYLEYLDMLRAVFAECVRALEPGGRLAINVANLGRKPYRSLSADIITILQDLGLLLRGEIIWQKAEGASGSCAWGSFRSPANPVFRDVTERIIVASKGRFDRAKSPAVRAREGLPHKHDILTDDFLALTLDTWSLPTESANRVGHPAPFPVELPERLIRLYTYEDDLVLDPFMGSGSTLIAAANLQRRHIGYDLDPTYVAIAKKRYAEMVTGAASPPTGEGKSASNMAKDFLIAEGFTITGTQVRVPHTGVVVSFRATDEHGQESLFDVAGSFTTHRGGLSRTETVWRFLGRGAALQAERGTTPYVLLTTELPTPRSEGDQALQAAQPAIISRVLNLRDR